MSLKFAKALQSQNKAIIRLMTEAFTPYVIKLGGGPISGPYPWIEAAIESGCAYVCLDETDIIGVVIITRQNSELIIDQLGVAPARQGEGIGSWLLEQVEQIARSEHLKTLSLHTAEMMSGLLRLYEKHGFSEIRKALPDHGEDEHLRVYMKKHI